MDPQSNQNQPQNVTPAPEPTPEPTPSTPPTPGQQPEKKPMMGMSKNMMMIVYIVGAIVVLAIVYFLFLK